MAVATDSVRMDAFESVNDRRCDAAGVEVVTSFVLTTFVRSFAAALLPATSAVDYVL